MPTDATGADLPARPTVRVAVQPALLASALGRLLRDSGWDVEAAGQGAQPTTSVAAAVVSQDSEIDLRDLQAELTVVLPDGAGRGGRLVRRDGDGRQLAPTGDPVRDLFDALAAS